MKTTETRARPRAATGAKDRLLARILILICILLTYWPLISNDFVTFDDNKTLYENPLMNPPTPHSFSVWWSRPSLNLYEPITWTARGLIALVARVPPHPPTPGTLDPRVYHGVSMLFHAVATLIVFQLFLRLNFSAWVACGAALLFALHPLQAEAVAWATSIKDLLCGLLSFASIAIYLKYEQLRSTSSPPRRAQQRLLYGTATLLFLLAILAKATAVVVPLMILILVARRHARLGRRAWIEMLPWTLLTLPMMLITRFAQPSTAVIQTALWQRPFIALDALAFYLWKIVWPLNLAVDYGRTPRLVFEQRWAWWTWLAPVSVAAVLWLSRRGNRLLLAGAAIAAVGLLPVLGLVPFLFQYISTVADRYVYLSMFGVAMAFACILQRAPARFGLVTVVPLLVLAVLCNLQVRFWHDSQSLFLHTLDINPQSAVACNDLAVYYVDGGRPDLAVPYAIRSTRLRPREGQGYVTVGAALSRMGRLNEATHFYRTAFAVDPGDAIVANNLAGVLAQQGQLDEAIPLIRQALRLDPEFAEAHLNLGSMLARNGNLAAAARELAEAIRLAPNAIPPRLNLAAVLLAMGRQQDAAAAYTDALEIDPTSEAARKGLARLQKAWTSPTKEPPR